MIELLIIWCVVSVIVGLILGKIIAWGQGEE